MRADLKGDCARCAALCCIVLGFEASADFAVDKPPGRPCHHLAPDLRCTVHAELRPRGFTGCTVYDCFGAGQAVTRAVLVGRDPRTDDAAVAAAAAVYPAVRALHELLWYLDEALALPAAAPLQGELAACLRATRQLADGTPEELAALDVRAHGRDVDELLQRAAGLVRAAAPRTKPPKRVRAGADLIGADLRRVDLRGADLRGAYLLGADLRGTALIAADLRGADLRAADVRGTDLTGCLFLTRPQAHAARGDAATRLPAVLDRPAQWRR